MAWHILQVVQGSVPNPEALNHAVDLTTLWPSEVLVSFLAALQRLFEAHGPRASPFEAEGRLGRQMDQPWVPGCPAAWVESAQDFADGPKRDSLGPAAQHSWGFGCTALSDWVATAMMHHPALACGAVPGTGHQGDEHLESLAVASLMPALALHVEAEPQECVKPDGTLMLHHIVDVVVVALHVT